MNDLIAVHISVRVGVLGYTPHALHTFVLHQAFHHVHVGAVLVHGHGDELEAKVLGHAEMPVITGHRAQELVAQAETPGGQAVHKALAPAQVDQVVHHAQGGVAAHDDLFRGDFQQLRKEAPCLRHTFQQAVVAGIHTVFADVIVHHPVHLFGKVQLLHTGFAAGHIKFQVLRLIAGVQLSQLRLLFQQLLMAHRKVVIHNGSVLPLACLRQAQYFPTLAAASGQIPLRPFGQIFIYYSINAPRTQGFSLHFSRFC